MSIKSLIIKGYEINFDKNIYEYNIEVSNDVFNGKKVIRESFYDSKTEYKTNYYFVNDTLVGIKREHSKYGDEVIIVDNITNTVEDKYFNKLIIPLL